MSVKTMQALSIWPPKTDPFVNFEQAPNLNTVVRRKFRNPNRFRDFTSRNQFTDSGYGFSSKYSRINLYVFWGHKRRSCTALALAFQEQTTVGEKNSNLDSEKELNLDSEQDSNLNSEVLNGFGLEKLETESEKEKVVGENKAKRVDTRALAWSLRDAKSVEDIDMVLKEKGDIPLQVYSTMIRGLGKDKCVDTAIALVEWLKQKRQNSQDSMGPNLFIYNSLLGAFKQAEQFEHVEKIMSDMSVDGISPNVVTYNTLMGIYLAQGCETKALDLFKEMQTKGLSPSPASYSTALLAYRRTEDGFGALDFYVDFRNKLKNGEIAKNDNEDWETEAAKLEDFVVRVCYQVTRRWLVKSENLSTNVLRLLTCMDQAGLQIGRAEHERLIWACTREDHYVVGKELYNRIREKYPKISLSVCNHVIWLFGKAKKWWAALEIYEDLLDKGPKPNTMSYELVVSHFNFLLAAAQKKGIWRWGVRLLNKMEEKGLKPGSKEWNSVLIACSKASETSAAVQIFKRMVEKGEKPTIISYGALLSALEKGKLYDEALRVWKHMIKVGLEPNAYAYTIMASIYAGQGKFNMVESIIREMPVSGVPLNVVTFNAIISSCARNNIGGPAYEWFQRMEAEGVKPNETTYEMLIEALVKDGKPRLAFDMFLRARDEGLTLASKAYDFVVESAQASGATIDVGLLGPRPLEMKKKVKIRKDLAEFCGFADVPRRSKPFQSEELFSPQTETSL